MKFKDLRATANLIGISVGEGPSVEGDDDAARRVATSFGKWENRF